MSNLNEATLAQARRHVEGGKRIIATQEEPIGQIEASGRDSSEARSMLDIFRRAQATFEDDLRQLTEDNG